MIRSCVTISLVEEARGGPFVFWDDLAEGCRKASELGFDAIEIFPPSASVIEKDRLRSLLEQHGLKLAAVGTGAGWVLGRLQLCSSTEGQRRQAKKFIHSIIDFAGSFGAPVIIGSMQGQWEGDIDRKTAIGYLTEALDELGRHSGQLGISLLFEPINRYETNLINTIESGLELLRSLQTDNIKLLADLFHMHIEESDVPAAIRRGGDRIGHIHFVDSNRRPAGYGHIDYASLATALEEIGYTGYLSAEAMPYPDPDAAARKTIETFRKYFR